MHILRMIYRHLMEEAGDDGAGGGAGGDGAGGDGDQGNPEAAAQRAEVEQRARDMGWAPKENWRGNPNSWIDAPEFVQRGEQVLPILQANLRKGEAKLSAVETQMQRQAAELQEARETIRVLTDLSTEQSRAAAKERRRELLRQQADARREGNAELEIELGEQIADMTSQINAAEVNDDGTPKPRKGAKVTPKTKQQQQTGDGNNNPTADPQYQQWAAENPWFGTDRRKTALATAIGEELRADPANAGLVGRAFFDRVTAEVNKVFAPARTTTSKVEGGTASAGSNGGGGGGNGKTFADLPADAKAACARQAKMLVGEGKAFKTEADWRKHYVTVYFNL